MSSGRKLKKAPPNTVVFRPESRNGYADFYISRTDAERLYEEGVIAQDMNNGGYCPIGERMLDGFKKQYQVK